MFLLGKGCMKKSLPGEIFQTWPCRLPPPPCFVYQAMGVRLSATHSEVCVDLPCFKSSSQMLWCPGLGRRPEHRGLFALCSRILSSPVACGRPPGCRSCRTPDRDCLLGVHLGLHWARYHRTGGLGVQSPSAVLRGSPSRGLVTSELSPFDLSESQGWTKGSDVLGGTGCAPGSSLLS